MQSRHPARFGTPNSSKSAKAAPETSSANPLSTRPLWGGEAAAWWPGAPGWQSVQRCVVAQALEQQLGNRQWGRALSGQRPPPGYLQRFEYAEHRRIGDTAFAREFGQRPDQVILFAGDERRGVAPYALPYGDVMALAGDWFESLEQMRLLAQTPSGRRQIEYARSQCQIVPEPGDITQAEREVVTRRYYELNQSNFHHFSEAGSGNSNLEAYLRGHRQAVDQAYLAGMMGSAERFDEALLAEAFAGHFLTDAFTAGHITAPRQAAEEHWGGLYPLFMRNFFEHVAEHMANHIQDNSLLAAIFTTIPGIKEDVIQSIESQAPPGAAYSLGGLCAVAVHDWHNRHGLAVVSARDPRGQEVQGGHAWTAYGENVSLETAAAGPQRAMVLAAAQAGLVDLKQARRFGQQKNLKQFKRLGPPYRVEGYVPRADAAAGADDFQWKFESVDGLVGDARMLEAIRELLLPAGKIGSLLDKAADTIGHQPQGHLAQPAFQDWVRRLRTSTGEVIREIANYVPGGVRHHATTDDLSRDYLNRLKAAQRLDELTADQMVGLIGKLLDGFTGAADERAILDILGAANRTGRVGQVVQQVGGFTRLAADFSGDEWHQLLHLLQESYFRGLALSDKQSLLRWLVTETLLEWGEEACIALLEVCSPAEFRQLVAAVGRDMLDDFLDGAEQDRFDELLNYHGLA